MQLSALLDDLKMANFEQNQTKNRLTLPHKGQMLCLCIVLSWESWRPLRPR
jgi:hypothetical protein